MAKSQTPAEMKAAKAEAKAASKAQSKQRRAQIWQAFQMQRKEDSRLLPYMIGAFLLVLAVSVALGVYIGGFTMYLMIVFGIVLGLMVAFIVFSRRAQKSVYRKAEGQTGAAAWLLDNMRGKWRVTPGVGVNGHFDAVHRVIGRPGVILVADSMNPDFGDKAIEFGLAALVTNLPKRLCQIGRAAPYIDVNRTRIRLIHYRYNPLRSLRVLSCSDDVKNVRIVT